jgi:hypothetical protein
VRKRLELAVVSIVLLATFLFVLKVYSSKTVEARPQLLQFGDSACYATVPKSGASLEEAQLSPGWHSRIALELCVF